MLLGGNHAAIGRWRRDRAIEKTTRVRPDLALALHAADLDGQDRATLAACGIAYPRSGPARHVTIRQAEAADAEMIAALAERTFPDACPKGLGRDAIAAYVAKELSAEAFARMLAAPDRFRVFVAQVGGELVGYVLSIVGRDALPRDMVRPGRVAEDSAYLSKCYVDQAWRGSGIGDALVERACADSVSLGHSAIVLGTNRANRVARAFYKRHGFRKRATRRFNVGGIDNDDVVMVRDLTAADGSPLAR